MQQNLNIIHTGIHVSDLLVWCGIALVIGLILYFFIYLYRKKLGSNNGCLETQEHYSLNPQDDGNCEAILLLSTNYEVVGANERFYHLTGMSSTDKQANSVEDIASIFPEQTRHSSLQKLLYLIKQGYGCLITEVSEPDGSIKLMCWQLFEIKQDGETMLHYLNVYVEPFPEYIDKVMELEHELQRVPIKQSQLALFLLSIEGMQQLLEDTQISTGTFLMLLKRELEMLDSATIVYYSLLEQEKIVIILSQDNIRQHVDNWAQSIIEATHYIVYNCSPSHYATVTIGVALSLPYRHNAESLLTNAGHAINMLKPRGVNGYYVYSSICS